MDERFQVGKTEITLIRGDITSVDAEAIVNAANSTLMGGGGVDGAIHARGGPQILEECKRIRATRWPNGLPTGEAIMTSGGNLKAKRVIHTVGPIWRGGTSGEPKLLKQACQNSLKLAVQAGLKSIAFPSISTGTYGYPIEKGAEVAIAAVREFLKNKGGLDRITFVLFTAQDLDIYKEKVRKALGKD